jgi:hypothetical protein
LGIVIDSTVTAVIERHPSIIIGTCDHTLKPVLARGFGGRVLDGGATVEVIVSKWPGPETLANIRATGRIALTLTVVETFEAYQIKGRVLDWGECDEEDDALTEAFVTEIRRRVLALGDRQETVERFFAPRGRFRVRLAPEAVFVQTPGSSAGRPL